MPANYTLLEKITVGAAGTSAVTFTNIPQTGYTDLVVKVSGRSSRTGTSSGDSFSIAFNGVGGTSYSDIGLRGSGSAVISYSDTSQPVADLGRVPAANQTASTFGNSEVYIPNYTGSTFKSIFVDTVSENNATEAYQTLLAGLFSNTAAITSINIATSGLGSWVQNSTFYLYGVAKLGTTPAIVPYATGGDTIMTDGTYWYHAFKSSGTFTPQKILSCDVVVVAGGGGAGADASAGQGAGGGAGGIFYATSQSLASGTGYAAIVGGGGAGNKAGNSGLRGDNGSNSTFASLTAAVGGGGGGPGNSTLGGASGGSGGGGGGGSSSTGTGGASTQTGTGGTGYGNAGGAGVSIAAGAGGGAGAVGGSASGSIGGTGGIGLNTWSSWASTTGTGDSGYFASGGNGWSTAATRPLGGGGPSSGTVAIGSAYANTGGGAGGFVGNGGSGIVLVRYAV